MKNPVIFLVFVFLITMSLAKVKTRKGTKKVKSLQSIITYHVSEQKAENDALSFSLQIRQTDASLYDAIQKADNLQKQVHHRFLNFCSRNHENYCQKKIDSTQYEIKVQYFRLRGEETFKAFAITFQIKLTISSFGLVGILIDQFWDLMRSHHIIIGEIEWEDTQNILAEENIMEEGSKRARLGCKNLGFQFYHIDSVSVHIPNPEQKQVKVKEKAEKEEDQEEEEEKKEEEDEEQKQQELKYKFVVKCRSNNRKHSKAEKLNIS